jgi:hypothetical protein
MSRSRGKCFVGDLPLHVGHIRLAWRPGLGGARRCLFLRQLRRDGRRLGPSALNQGHVKPSPRGFVGRGWRPGRRFLGNLPVNGR